MPEDKSLLSKDHPVLAARKVLIMKATLMIEQQDALQVFCMIMTSVKHLHQS